MNQFEFDEALGVVESQFGRFDDSMRNLLRGRYQSLSSEIWVRMCNWIIDHCGVRPKANKFLEAKQKVSPSYYSAQKKDELDECDSCCGSGFDVSYFIKESNQLPYSCVSPCLSCNGGQYMPQMRVRISRFITRSEYLEIQKDRAEEEHESERAIVEGEAETFSDNGEDNSVEAWIPE